MKSITAKLMHNFKKLMLDNDFPSELPAPEAIIYPYMSAADKALRSPPPPPPRRRRTAEMALTCCYEERDQRAPMASPEDFVLAPD